MVYRGVNAKARNKYCFGVVVRLSEGRNVKVAMPFCWCSEAWSACEGLDEDEDRVGGKDDKG